MEGLSGQDEGEHAVPITYPVEIFAARGGEEVRQDLHVSGSRICELAERLVAQALQIESEAEEKLGTAETKRGESGRAELSGRRRRSWE